MSENTCQSKTKFKRNLKRSLIFTLVCIHSTSGVALFYHWIFPDWERAELAVISLSRSGVTLHLANENRSIPAYVLSYSFGIFSIQFFLCYHVVWKDPNPQSKMFWINSVPYVVYCLSGCSHKLFRMIWLFPELYNIPKKERGNVSSLS